MSVECWLKVDVAASLTRRILMISDTGAEQVRRGTMSGHDGHRCGSARPVRTGQDHGD
jgi:hypothetical protein